MSPRLHGKAMNYDALAKAALATDPAFVELCDILYPVEKAERKRDSAAILGGAGVATIGLAQRGGTTANIAHLNETARIADVPNPVKYKLKAKNVSHPTKWTPVVRRPWHSAANGKGKITNFPRNIHQLNQPENTPRAMDEIRRAASKAHVDRHLPEQLAKLPKQHKLIVAGLATAAAGVASDRHYQHMIKKPKLVEKMGPDVADVHAMGSGRKTKRIKRIEVAKRSSISAYNRQYKRDDTGRFSSAGRVLADSAAAGVFGAASLTAGAKTALNSKELLERISRSNNGRKAALKAIGHLGPKTIGLAAVGGVAGAFAGHHGKQVHAEITQQMERERQHRNAVKAVTGHLNTAEAWDNEKSNAYVVTGSGKTQARTKIIRPGANQTRIFRVPDEVKKADVRLGGELTELDVDKHQAFGWASITELDGKPVVDLQGDYISNEELEKAAYRYVLDSRVGGAMHYKVDDNGNLITKSKPYHAADLIESFVVTPEKIEKMGMQSNKTGWWIGMQVNDDEVWKRVKSGEWKGFSIHGMGKRTDRALTDFEIDGAEVVTKDWSEFNAERSAGKKQLRDYARGADADALGAGALAAGVGGALQHHTGTKFVRSGGAKVVGSTNKVVRGIGRTQKVIGHVARGSGKVSLLTAGGLGTAAAYTAAVQYGGKKTDD